MPIVTVSLFGGRSQREKDRLAEAITESVCKILGVDKKEVYELTRKIGFTALPSYVIHYQRFFSSILSKIAIPNSFNLFHFVVMNFHRSSLSRHVRCPNNYEI